MPRFPCCNVCSIHGVCKDAVCWCITDRTNPLLPQQVLRLAHAKADAIRAKLQAAAGVAGQPLDGLLVTCDQVAEEKEGCWLRGSCPNRLVVSFTERIGQLAACQDGFV